MKYILLLIFVLLINSCSTTQQKLNPATYYKNDMCFQYNDYEFCGVGVLPNKENYEIKVKSHGKLNFFSIITCHREDTTENPDKTNQSDETLVMTNSWVKDKNELVVIIRESSNYFKKKSEESF